MFNQKQKIVLLVCVVLTLVSTAILIFSTNQGASNQLKFTNLDSFLASDPEFAGQKTVKSIGLERKDIDIPLPTKNNLQKITMVPVLAVGGDAIYEPIAQINQNEFVRLNQENASQFFTINTPEEALKYVDFLLTKLGNGGYDRARETIWSETDYQNKNCNLVSQYDNSPSTEKNFEPIPIEKPISQAKKSDKGFAIDWVYFTPTVPAGYFKESLQVDKNGQITFQDKPENPFWACQDGFVF